MLIQFRSTIYIAEITLKKQWMTQYLTLFAGE